MSESDAAEQTIFDKIISGEIEVQRLFENEHVLAFPDINPQAPVHVLVIPKKRLSYLSESPECNSLVMGHFLQGVALCARSLNLEESGYRVVINNGAAANQSVLYLHAHILAGRQMHWPPG